MWRSFLRGHNVLYMDRWSVEREDPEREGVRRALGAARKLSARVSLLRLRPSEGLASSGYCLASPGEEYVILSPAGGSLSLDLTGAEGSLAVEWVDPLSGERSPGGTIDGGGSRAFRRPAKRASILHLTKR